MLAVINSLRFTLLIWLGSIFALLGVDSFLLDPLRSIAATAAVFAVQALPILLCAPLALRNPGRGAFWVSLAALLYFVDGVVTAFDPERRLIGALEILCALGAFTTALLLMRASAGVRGP
jgi:uncharacterized membrane protein